LHLGHDFQVGCNWTLDAGVVAGFYYRWCSTLSENHCYSVLSSNEVDLLRYST